MNANAIKAFVKIYYLALLALFLTLFLSILGYQYSNKRIEERRQKIFESRTSLARAAIETRLKDYVQVLRGARGLFVVDDSVTREDWKNYYYLQEVERNYPGLIGIGYAEVISLSELEKYKERVRKEGYKSYEVFPGTREDSLVSVVHYIEPFYGGNLKIWGQDMYNEPVRKRAMEIARDTETPTISGKVNLLMGRGDGNWKGFLLYLPVYEKGKPHATVEQRRQNIKGYIFGKFRAHDLMQATFQDRFQDLDIEIYDGEIIPENIIYDKNPERNYFNHSTNNLRNHFAILLLSGTTWKVYFNILPSFGSAGDHELPYLVLAAGVVTSILLFLVLYSWTKTQQSDKLKQTITDNATAALFMIDLNGYCSFMNPAAEAMTGYTFEEITQKPLHEMIHSKLPDESPYPTEECPILRAISEKKEIRLYEDVFLRKDGTLFNVTCSAKPIYEKGQPISTVIEVRDITEEKTAKLQLEQSTERTRFLAESMPQKVWTANADGEMNYFNQYWLEYTGLSLDEILGWGWKQVIHPEDKEHTEVVWENSLKSKQPFQLENRLRNKHGEYRWHLTRGVPQLDSQGNVVLWVGTNTEIHDQKLNAEELQEKNRTLKILNEIGITVSGELELKKLIQAVTDATTELIGAEFGAFFYNEQDENGEAYTLYSLSECHSIISGSLPENASVFKPVFYGAEVVRSDDTTSYLNHEGNLAYFSTPEGYLPVISYLAVPVIARSGELMGGLFFGHSQPGVFKGKAEDLVIGIASQAAIAIENSRLFEKMKSQNDELVKINNDLDNFIYTASHDLKAPVSNIEGLIYNLVEVVTDETRKCKDFQIILGMMSKSVSRFKATIQDLTDITKIQKENPGGEELIDLNEVTERVKEDIRTMVEESEAQIHLETAGAFKMKFSKVNFTSVIYNLVSNAIKYRHPDRKPLITIKAAMEGSHIIIRVKDNGLGFRKEHADKAFSMFKRFHNHVEGSGIGLYIVKRLVENAGGEIKLESEENVGSEFQITLPVTKPTLIKA
ncbi:MAG TPA: CHASE domain-containing protein [Cytophagaceae bacterium]